MSINDTNLQVSPFYKLPNEVISRILMLGNLSAKDLLNVSAVDTKLRKLANNNEFWKAAFLREYSDSTNPAFKEKWKERTLIWQQFPIAKMVDNIFNMKKEKFWPSRTIPLERYNRGTSIQRERDKLLNNIGNQRLFATLCNKDKMSLPCIKWVYLDKSEVYTINFKSPLRAMIFEFFMTNHYTNLDVYEKVDAIREENKLKCHIAPKEPKEGASAPAWMHSTGQEIEFMLNRRLQKTVQEIANHNLQFFSSLDIQTCHGSYFPADAQGCFSHLKQGQQIQLTDLCATVEIINNYQIPFMHLVNCKHDGVRSAADRLAMDQTISAWRKELGIDVKITDNKSWNVITDDNDFFSDFLQEALEGCLV